MCERETERERLERAGGGKERKAVWYMGEHSLIRTLSQGPAPPSKGGQFCREDRLRGRVGTTRSMAKADGQTDGRYSRVSGRGGGGTGESRAQG